MNDAAPYLRACLRLVVVAVACVLHLAARADVEAGKAKAEAVCRTCHGLDGRGVAAMVANIGGQQKAYLVKQLEDFRAGRRRHEQMSIIAKMLSDEDIDDVAAWYSSVTATFEIPR